MTPQLAISEWITITYLKLNKMASNKKDLKAFVRYDGTGRVVSSSVILARTKPKVGNWKEIQTYECCGPVVGDFLLLESSTPEDNQYILQEDGSRIIL